MKKIDFYITIYSDKYTCALKKYNGYDADARFYIFNDNLRNDGTVIKSYSNYISVDKKTGRTVATGLKTIKACIEKTIQLYEQFSSFFKSDKYNELVKQFNNLMKEVC